MEEQYTPKPIDTSDVQVGEDVIQLAELLAKNTHEVWAKGRLADGWRYGEVLDVKTKQRPDLVPYEQLPEREKDFDRNTSMEALKVLVKLGYQIIKKDQN